MSAACRATGIGTRGTVGTVTLHGEYPRLDGAAVGDTPSGDRLTRALEDSCAHEGCATPEARDMGGVMAAAFLGGMLGLAFVAGVAVGFIAAGLAGLYG